jgi:hypothetical protein
MHTLEHKPNTRLVIVIVLAALVATIAFRFLFAEPESIMSGLGYGIVPYELAYSVEQAGHILSAWGTEGQAAARRSLLIDFGFMPAYALLFGGITLLIARAQSGWLRRAGMWLTLAPFAAALLDLLENLALLRMLGTEAAVPSLLPAVAGGAATLKFALLLIAILYWLGAGLSTIARRIRHPA